QKQDEALAVYRKMMELFPQDPQPPYFMGTILLSQGGRAEARKAFERSAKIFWGFLPALEKLVDLDLVEEQYDSALSRLQEHLEKAPKLGYLWMLRGRVYLAQRDFARAEADLRRAIELEPTLQPGYVLLAQVYNASGKQEQAIKELSGFAETNKSIPVMMQL